ncbi:lactate utilization protein [Deltaproteobacteria bacterium OttesenSCG-928-K17]|nr:lactate utilization protein [Deltaproteobacteria bacterium OttesenSCG-928-K17]
MTDKEILAWQKQCAAERLIKKMEKRGIHAVYAEDGPAAKKAVLEMVPAEGAVGLLGSQTMNQIGVYAHFRESGRELVDHATQTKGMSPEEADAYRRRIFQAEAMLASANALDAEGRIYNIDGVGNRVAAMIFGPKKVVLAVSLNKVAPTPEEAWRRARQTASPMNNKRIGLPNPCVKSGHCHDCQLESSICNYFSIIDRSRPAGRISVVLIGEDFGY